MSTPEPDQRRLAAEEALGSLALDHVAGRAPEIVSRPRLSLKLATFAAASRPRLDPQIVSRAQLRFPPSVYDRVETGVDGQQWWTCAVPRHRPEPHLNPETDWCMRLVRPGHLEFEAKIGHRVQDDPQILVDGCRLEARIIRNLERMGEIAAEVGLSGPALISVSFSGMEDVELTMSRPGGRRIRLPEVHLAAVEVADPSKPLAGALRDELDVLWQAAGWRTGSPSFSAGDWAGYSDARSYSVD